MCTLCPDSSGSFVPHNLLYTLARKEDKKVHLTKGTSWIPGQQINLLVVEILIFFYFPYIFPLCL